LTYCCSTFGSQQNNSRHFNDFKVISISRNDKHSQISTDYCILILASSNLLLLVILLLSCKETCKLCTFSYECENLRKHQKIKYLIWKQKCVASGRERREASSKLVQFLQIEKKALCNRWFEQKIVVETIFRARCLHIPSEHTLKRTLVSYQRHVVGDSCFYNRQHNLIPQWKFTRVHLLLWFVYHNNVRIAAIPVNVKAAVSLNKYLPKITKQTFLTSAGKTSELLTMPQVLQQTVLSS